MTTDNDRKKELCWVLGVMVYYENDYLSTELLNKS